MRTLLTPLEIETVLGCHCLLGPVKNNHAPAVRDTIHCILNNGIITERVPLQDSWELREYRTTDKGEAFVKMLCSTPYPEVVYRNPITNEEIQ